MKGATLQFATLEAPFDDTVPLDDMSASSPDSPLAPSTAVIVAPPPRSSSSSSLPQQPQSDLVEGQIMPIPEHINNAYDTAPIVDSDEGRSYESEGTTVQTVLPAPVTRAAAFSSVLVLFLINLLNYMDRYTIAGKLSNINYLLVFLIFLSEAIYFVYLSFSMLSFRYFIVRIQLFLKLRHHHAMINKYK